MKLSKGLDFICLFLFICSVNSQQPQRQESHQQRHQAKKIQQLAKTRRIYAMCPPGFTKIGNECYFLSSSKASWLDSHFECKDKNGKLAEPIRDSDRRLRKYLNERGRTRGDIWIGGMYNWQRMKWQWGYNGKDIKHQSFSRMKPGGSEDLKYNCAVLNPDLKYRWSAKLCFEKHFYLCQHRMPFVSERSRQRIYAKWNETYPGQFANEIQVYVTTNGSSRREYYRATSKRPDASTIPAARDQNAQASNLVPSMSRYKGVMSNEINPPEVLLNRDAVIQNKLRRNKKQQISRGREHKSLNLTGNVDLGSMNLKQNKLSRRRNGTRRMSTTTTTTTQHPNTISEIFQPNHHSHRHNHYDNREEKDYRKPEPAPTPYPVTYRPETSTTKAFIVPTTTTALPSSSDNTTQKLSKEAEKKYRVEALRKKLSNLTEEQRLEYMRIKAERKAAKLQSINDTLP